MVLQTLRSSFSNSWLGSSFRRISFTKTEDNTNENVRHSLNSTSWALLEERGDPAKGAISSDYGFMGNPQLMAASEENQSTALTEMAKRIPALYAAGVLRDHVTSLTQDFHFSTDDLQGYDLLLAKSTVFTLAQAFVDCTREDRGPGEPQDEPPPFPEAFQEMLERISERVESVPYCTLPDICLYNVRLSSEALASLEKNQLHPTDLTFRDMSLRVPVLNAIREGELESDRSTRERVESRFSLTTVEMGYATCDMPRLVARAQQLMSQALDSPSYTEEEFVATSQELIQCLKELRASANRMHQAFSKLGLKDVPAKVWHREFAKLTLGYNGNGGPSGPQHPTVHLLDIFLGRINYNTELGTICQTTRSLLAANHQEFLQAVQDGPKVQDYLPLAWEQCPRLAQELQESLSALIEEYTSKGFLGAHRKKAYAFLKTGFSGQVPRTFTAGSTCNCRKDVPTQMLESFNDSMRERVADFSERRL